MDPNSYYKDLTPSQEEGVEKSLQCALIGKNMPHFETVQRFNGGFHELQVSCAELTSVGGGIGPSGYLQKEKEDSAGPELETETHE